MVAPLFRIRPDLLAESALRALPFVLGGTAWMICSQGFGYRGVFAVFLCPLLFWGLQLP